MTHVTLVIGEPYRSDVSPEYAIRGNSVLFKCSIPPFVADFVTVVSWIDDAGNSYFNVDRNKVTDYGTQSVTTIFNFKLYMASDAINRVGLSRVGCGVVTLVVFTIFSGFFKFCRGKK